MYLQRSLASRLLRLSETFPAVVITGARQVGKSTLLAETFRGRAEAVVFDPVLDVGGARSEPDLFLESHRTPLILDEIQYAPPLVAALKRRIDRDRRPGQYLLTGSQQWGVLRSVAESLAGRAAFLDLEGFSLAELAAAAAGRSWLEEWLDDAGRVMASPPARLALPRPLFEQMWRGFLPEAQFIPLDTVPDFHAAYQRTYVERDVRLLSEISDWHLFGRFTRLAAALTAQEVNHSQFGREIGITPQTARRWLELLRATFQWSEVPGYSGNTVKRVSGRPKGYFTDVGVACASQAISTPAAIAGHPLFGAMFETAVAGEIRRLAGALPTRPQAWHWRAHSGAEVDLLLERDGAFFPIEIKATSHPTHAAAAGLRAFREAYPSLRIAPGLVLAPIDRPLRLSESDLALPWDLGPVVSGR